MAKRKKQTRKITFLMSTTILLVIMAAAFYFLRREDFGVQLPPPPPDAIYKQADRPIEARVANLLSYMTLEEKIGQMSLVDKNSLVKTEDISRYNLGAVLSGAGGKPENNTPEGWAELANSFKAESQKSRLQIPILYGVDANHGHANVPGATVFPHEIGLGASNDEALVQKVATITSEELKSTGINWNYSPSLDAPKDIRWGRVYEAFSDDVERISRLGSAYVSGAQSSEDNDSILTSAKHFLGTGSMQWGSSEHKSYQIDHGIIPEDEQALLNNYLPPFKAAVDAGVASVMVALTRYGDSRIIDNEYLLTNLLKEELGFDGFVVSDWYGVYEYAESSKYDANVSAINAGLDMAMLPFDYKQFLRDVRKAVDNNDILIGRIDDAVARILRKKFEAGLFDSDQTQLAYVSSLGSEEHRTTAREAVSKSAVLLRNNNVLPLNPSAPILIAGSGADNIGRQTGAWTVEWQGINGNDLPGATSILQAVKSEIGSELVDYEIQADFSSKSVPVGIVVVSEPPYAEGFGDNPSPEISQDDLEAIINMQKLADKVVVVIISGRPLILPNQFDEWDGLIAAWLPGSEAAGLSDLLYGRSQFRATLPLPWPQSTSQLPISNQGATADNTPVLFERGFGLQN
jgi:beta-glucosidase